MARLVVPTNLHDACAELESSPGAVALAGGTALQMLRRRGEFQPETLVDLRAIPGISDITRDGDREEDGIVIGALATHARVEHDPIVRSHAPVLCDVASQIANTRVRNAATIGGNLAHRDHRLDPPGVLMVLGARLDIASASETRTIEVGELFCGFADKTLARGEVIARIRIPRSRPTTRLAYQKFKSRGANDWPCASVAARLDTEAGTPTRLSLGLTAVAPSPVHLTLDLTDRDRPQALKAADDAVAAAVAPVDDLRGDAAFKRRVIRVIVADTVTRLWDAR